MSGNQPLEALIRTIPDFPKPGIMFRDITTLLQDPTGFRETVDQLVAKYKDKGITKVVAIESRGFLIGGAMAYHLKAGVVVARKPGKLPSSVISETYDLEYGTDSLELHEDSLSSTDKCLVVDDLIATGGTANAAIKLVKKLGAEVVGCAFIVNLPDLKGVDALDAESSWLISYPGH